VVNLTNQAVQRAKKEERGYLLELDVLCGLGGAAFEGKPALPNIKVNLFDRVKGALSA